MFMDGETRDSAPSQAGSQQAVPRLSTPDADVRMERTHGLNLTDPEGEAQARRLALPGLKAPCEVR